MANPVSQVTSWQFMNEPLNRWFIFVGAMIAINYAWYGVLRLIRDVAE